MSLSYNSISESAISELPPTPIESDLEIELFSDISVARTVPINTLTLVLSYDNDIIYPVYYGGNKDPWLVNLETTGSDVVQQIFSFAETANLEISESPTISVRLNSVDTGELEILSPSTSSNRFEIPTDTIELVGSITSIERPSWLISDPAILGIDGEYFHNLRLYSNETTGLSIEIIEKNFPDDNPTDLWRDRPGLPIGPITLNSIAIEQSIGPTAKVYPDTSQAELEINASEVTSSTVSRSTVAELIIETDESIQTTNVYVDSGNLTTISISDQVVFINSNETAYLEISATDQIRQIYQYIDNAEIVIQPEDNINSIFNDFSSSILDITARTYAKEYTFLQQITSIETIRTKIEIKSKESFIEVKIKKPKQIWSG